MSTEQIWQTVSTSSDETLKLAADLGRRLRGGEVIELISDLGGGKTTFVRGLAAGIGSADHVHSPSFTLTNEYAGEKIRLFHFDLYRLSAAGIIGQEINEIMNQPRAVVVVEWPELIGNILPDDRLSVKLSVAGETERQIIFNYTKNLNYLFPQYLTC